MNRTLITTWALACALAWAQPAAALTEVAKHDDLTIGVGGRLQAMGFAEQLQADPYRSAGRIYLFLKQSRLELAARKGEVSFYSQLALGGEDVYTSNTNLTLLDMYAAGPLYGLASWRVGQFRVPFGRELMSNGGRLAFLDRSITAPFFTNGRDVGASLQGQVGPASVIAGVFTGGGRDTPQRYLPEILGIPMLVARASVGDVDADPYDLGQHDYQDTDRLRLGAGAGAMFTRDSRVGHSTVLNIKNTFEKSLLLSPGWNPYIGKKDPTTGEPAQGQLFQAGLDGAMRLPVAGGVASGEAELTYGSFGNEYGSLGVFGGRAQAAFYRKPYELALRYAVLFPDARFAATNATAGSPSLGATTAVLPDGAPIHEITPAFTWFLDGERLKLVFDLPVLLNAPIVTEKGIGSYNLVNQPDQTGLLTNPANTSSRQLVVQLRGGLQCAF
ncbi:MAG: hypothetical protein JWM80_3415 [Cyanobacteria bacterium RYN_339]|nr:hypothetical protein [Cyanobacteria bacterium RYN_339]